MNDSAEEDNDPFEQLLGECLERVESGEVPNLGALVAQYPQHEAALRSFFANHQWAAGWQDPAAIESLVGQSIDAYELVGELGRGGMGVVYRAKHPRFGDQVALKLLPRAALADRESVRRFRAESATVARLHHPGIVPLFEAGTWEGRPYFAMQRVDGMTLEACMQGERLPIETVVKIGSAAARALDYAHGQGVVHRDVKPANILLDASMQPLLADFGLAKLHGEMTAMTITGQILGTPNYMAPEQAAGDRDVAPSSDIYGLGAVLYAMLTGRPPQEASSPAAVLQKLLSVEPIPLRQLRGDIPKPLAQIVMHCLERRPSDRYATAAALADDLQRFQQGAGHQIARRSWWQRVGRTIGRQDHVAHFANWWKAVAQIGVVVFLMHLWIFTGQRLQWGLALTYILPRIAMFSLLAALILYYRNGIIKPRGPAERPIWSIWLAYLAALTALNVVLFQSGQPATHLFPLAAILGGFGFVAMGSILWGGCYVIGGVMIASSPLMQAFPDYGSLALGTLWLIGMSSLASHYRRQAQLLPRSKAIRAT
jgi:eukaryotic-like serine/threonine-protein kinase